MAALPRSWKNKEGIKVDTLFLNGSLDCDTYYRYLRDYAKQIRRHGVAQRAVGTVRNGTLTYRFTDRKDYSGFAIGEAPHYRPEAEWHQLFSTHRPHIENRQPLTQKQTTSDTIGWWWETNSSSPANVIDDWHRSIENSDG